jgi:hypothetical protein
METLPYEEIWKACSEEDVHLCIEEAFSNSGYDVTVLHRRDKQFENGVDIECTKDGEKLFFAVKLDPRKSDIPQLKKLSERNDTNERIYVYLKKPPKDFRDAIEIHKSRVKFWDADTLHRELVVRFSPRYLGLIVRATPIMDNLLKIWLSIHLKRMGKAEEPEKSSYRHIWDLKDRSCMLNGMGKIIHNHYKSIVTRKDELKEEEILDIFDQILLDIAFMNKSLDHFAGNLERLAKENPAVISLMWRRVYERTFFGVLKFNRDESDEKVLKQSFTDWIITSDFPPHSTYQYLISILDCLNRSFDNLEYCIDVIYNDKILNKKKNLNTK